MSFDSLPVVWINCESAPFLDYIGAGLKIFETRGRNVLRALVEKRVILAETGRGRHLARYTAVIDYAVPVYDRKIWDVLRGDADHPGHLVPVDNQYDWKPNTRVKWLYRLTEVEQIPIPFTVTHYDNIGRSWAIMKEE